jgi:molybdopterin-guanine dinucleotide biosynthesis protein A
MPFVSVELVEALFTERREHDMTALLGLAG